MNGRTPTARPSPPSSAGGRATNAGTDFQSRVASWAAVQILAEKGVRCLGAWELGYSWRVCVASLLLTLTTSRSRQAPEAQSGSRQNGILTFQRTRVGSPVVIGSLLLLRRWTVSKKRPRLPSLWSHPITGRSKPSRSRTSHRPLQGETRLLRKLR